MFSFYVVRISRLDRALNCHHHTGVSICSALLHYCQFFRCMLDSNSFFVACHSRIYCSLFFSFLFGVYLAKFKGSTGENCMVSVLLLVIISFGVCMQHQCSFTRSILVTWGGQSLSRSRTKETFIAAFIVARPLSLRQTTFIVSTFTVFLVFLRIDSTLTNNRCSGAQHVTLLITSRLVLAIIISGSFTLTRTPERQPFASAINGIEFSPTHHVVSSTSWSITNPVTR